MDIAFCPHFSDTELLVRLGYWPVTPTQPSTAISINLMNFYMALVLNAQISVHSFTSTVAYLNKFTPKQVNHFSTCTFNLSQAWLYTNFCSKWMSGHWAKHICDQFILFLFIFPHMLHRNKWYVKIYWSCCLRVYMKYLFVWSNFQSNSLMYALTAEAVAEFRLFHYRFSTLALRPSCPACPPVWTMYSFLIIFYFLGL